MVEPTKPTDHDICDVEGILNVSREYLWIEIISTRSCLFRLND